MAQEGLRKTVWCSQPLPHGGHACLSATVGLMLGGRATGAFHNGAAMADHSGEMEVAFISGSWLKLLKTLGLYFSSSPGTADDDCHCTGCPKGHRSGDGIYRETLLDQIRQLRLPKVWRLCTTLLDWGS